jgi:hypothetical protein
MPTFDEALDSLEQQLFVGRDRELALFEQWLTSGKSAPEVLHIHGRGGVGKSALLRGFARLGRQAGWPVVLADSRDFPHTTRGLRRALAAGRDDAVAYLNATCPLLLLDTFEELGALSRDLQALLAQLDTGVRVVLAGRYPSGFMGSADSPWRSLVRTLPLEPFTGDESREYLQRRGLQDPELRDQVARTAYGNPLALSLAADMVLQLGLSVFAVAPERRLVVRSLVEQLLRDVKDQRLRELLEACSVVRQFDEALLAAIAGEAEVRGAFGKLCRLSAVHPTEHGLMLHDEVRHSLAEDLRWRDPHRYQALRLRALTHYRQRAGTAGHQEREWLLMERVYLWGHALLQQLFFAADEPEPVWVEPGQPADYADVQHIFAWWHEHVLRAQLQDYPPEWDPGAVLAFHAELLRSPATRLRMVRDGDGRALGFNTGMAICRESLPILERHPALAPVLHAYWSPADLAALPRTADEATAFYFVVPGHLDVTPQAVNAAVLRDLFGVLALGQLYFCSTALPTYKHLLEALGFERVPGGRYLTFASGDTMDGYVLDLARIGVEPWIEALLGGRPLPKETSSAPLERELQAMLRHWSDDAWLARSPLIQILALPGAGSAADQAAALRQTTLRALARARVENNPEGELAYRALELAYLEKATSHEQAAERLAVSIATFYRLLKRGVRDLARALAEP